MRKNRRCAFAAAFGMLILILDSRTALLGAAEGIVLCIRTLIPSLLPFFVLSAIITGNLIGQPIRLLRPVCSFCGVPRGAESLLAVGLLGGYPVGARNIAQGYREGVISKSDAECMLSFCNNAGPAFIFGILGRMFSHYWISWLLWGIHILSALLVGAIMKEKSGKTAELPCRSISLSDALESSLKVMGLVCGWVILFRMVLTFLDRWILWYLPEAVQVLFAGFLELSNGCVQLERIPSEGVRFLLAGIFLSAGGLCVTMQTISVTKGLSLKPYFLGKGIQTAISFLVCCMIQPLFEPDERVNVSWIIPVCALVICMFFVLILCIQKKRSSNPGFVGV